MHAAHCIMPQISHLGQRFIEETTYEWLWQQRWNAAHCGVYKRRTFVDGDWMDRLCVGIQKFYGWENVVPKERAVWWQGKALEIFYSVHWNWYNFFGWAFFLGGWNMFCCCLVHSSTLLSFRVGTLVCFSNLGACRPPSTVGRWRSTWYNPTSKNLNYPFKEFF